MIIASHHFLQSSHSGGVPKHSPPNFSGKHSPFTSPALAKFTHISSHNTFTFPPQASQLRLVGWLYHYTPHLEGPT